VALEEVDGRVDALREQFAASLRAAGHVARELSEARKQVAGELARAISNELAALSMGGARVEVEVAPHDGARSELEVDGARLTPDGLDRVEFLIAPNKGIAPRPLRKIASGGELSRSLLAIKRVLASKGPAGLYVFDEVDTGVGGAVAERLGQALADIARHRQVLCITHLAPIAALADAHFVVRKTQHGAVATTAIQPVRDSDRVREVARMLSGARISRACLQTAEEMLRSRAAC
jgi:DNA repair protein RecN (Recombination protein N)